MGGWFWFSFWVVCLFFCVVDVLGFLVWFCLCFWGGGCGVFVWVFFFFFGSARKYTGSNPAISHNTPTRKITESDQSVKRKKQCL